MKNIEYIVFAIILSQFISIQDTDIYCEDYKNINDLNECFNKITDQHHICCGYNISFSDTKSLISCKDLLASNISIDLFREHLKEEFNNSFEFICPKFEEKINGTCSEYNNFPVEDGNKCLSLIGETDKTCCSLKYQMKEKIEEFPFPPNYTECISLPNSKSKMDEEIKNINDSFNFEGLELVIKCGEVNGSNIINYYILISSMIISLLII